MASFLNSYKTSENNSTHTRIGDKQLNIYPGKYFVSNNDQDKFLQEYFNNTFLLNKVEYLTEKQLDNGVIAIDLDFRYCHEVNTRQHDKSMIRDIVLVSVDFLKDFYNFTSESSFEVFVMEKPNVNRLADGSLTKDGIHIIIGINMEKAIKVLYRNKLVHSLSEYVDLPLINTWDSVVDKAVLEGSTNWQLFGSKKPGNEAYCLTYQYNFTFDENDKEFMMTEQQVCDINLELLKKLSVRNNDRPLVEPKVIKDNNEIEQRNILSPTSVETFNTSNLDEIELLLEIIGSKRCSTGNQKEWVDIAQAIKNHCKDDGLKYFVNWTNKYGSENKKRECIEQYTKYNKYTPIKEQNRLSIKSLYYWAKNDNPTQYKKLFIKQKESSYTKEELDIFIYLEDEVIPTGAENKIAKSIFKIFGEKHKCVNTDKKIMYSFDAITKIWERNENARVLRNLISDDYAKLIVKLKNYYEQEKTKYNSNDEENITMINIKSKATSSLEINLYKTTFKNHICAEYFDTAYDKKFEGLVNNSKNILSLKNGLIFDITTCLTREKTIDDLFTYECDATFIPYNSTDENFIFVEKYFNDLFCNNLNTAQCVLDILKSSFIGKPLRYLFFAIGDGRNGKSVLFQVLQQIFKNAMDTISKLVIIKQKGNHSSSINSELQKLIKCRLAYVSELSDEEELNVTRIKEITGGDPIDYRGLFKDNETITPTCNLFNLTNQLPKFKVQKAICDRIINIPFKNEFQKDTEFEAKIMKHKDYLFSYIMCKGVIRDNFIESEEMLESKRNYIESNNQDYLKDFITDTFEIVEYDNTENTRIKRDDFRTEYNYWCKMKTYPLNAQNDSTFSKNMNKLYNIDNKQIGKAKKVYFVGLKRLVDEEVISIIKA